MRLVAALVTLLPAFAFAGGFRQSVQDASEQMDQALALARRGGAACRQSMKASIDRSTDDVDDLLGGRDERRLYEVREQVNVLALSASRSGCPDTVGRKLSRAVEMLDDARRGWAGRERDERPDGRVSRGSTPVEVAQLRLTSNTIHDTENVVQVDVPEVRFHQSRGTNFRLGMRVRALNGQFGEWQVDAMYQVPDDEYVWPNAHTFFLRHSILRGIDTANGRYVVRVSVLNENNEELGAVDQPLDINFRGPPAPAPNFVVAAPPPPPGQPSGAAHVRPIPTLVQRDCGTGADPGCGVNRNGVLAMDRATFSGLMASLLAQPSELNRENMVNAILVNNGLTAAQFSQILDQFRSELTKLNVARRAAPRLTNPHDAIGFSVKFRSSLNQTEYVRLISAQG